MTPLILLVALAHAALVLAQAAGSTLSIYSPSTAVWWVQNANNTLAWTGTGPTAFAVWLSNPDVTLIPADVKLKTFSPNYTVKLTAVNDTATLYATSDSFQIVPFGSPRAQVSTSAPAASATGVIINDPTGGTAAPADPYAVDAPPTDGGGGPVAIPNAAPSAAAALRVGGGVLALALALGAGVAVL
ncbi:hypothetical protein Q8F55_008185 [Vanrija albida]|uniref:Phytocyanin domain-containing protein n=1 Tax=Vanrija albida TaxID=181172 RepID=A0ABR3PVN0_9TREE